MDSYIYNIGKCMSYFKKILTLNFVMLLVCGQKSDLLNVDREPRTKKYELSSTELNIWFLFLYITENSYLSDPTA